MNKEMSKEQGVFLAGALLFVWVMVKLAIFLAHQPGPPSTPMVAAAAVQLGDNDIAGLLASGSLESYLGRGSRDPFTPHASQPAQFFVRAMVAHSFMASAVFSRYTYDCRMSPTPLREVRLQLPARAAVTDVFCKEMDTERKWGVDVDGRVLVVPVKPTFVKRSYYRCLITVVLRAPVSAPGTWIAPVISCTDATPNVQCEIGHIAVATPGDQVILVPKEGADTGLVKIGIETVPTELAALSNKLAYSFRQPNYTLTLELKTKVPIVAEVPPKGKGPVIRPKDGGPVIRPKDDGPVVKDPPKKLDIPPPDDADKLPFKLSAIVRIHEPEPRRQAVLRDKKSGEYFRKFEGEPVLDDLKVLSISDDSVIIEDGKGKRYKFRGRFEDKYNE